MAKSPYSLRNLISNMEPYPDTFHYIIPARSLASGGPFAIARESRTLKPTVPPLYSLFLLPAYFINHDPRTFYFVNIILSCISLWLLSLILKKITENKWIYGLILFLFATNYYMYWYPQWAMAENLILPIFLLGIYLLMTPISKPSFLVASAVPFLTFFTKYAYLPFAAIYFFLYFVKVLKESGKKKISNLLKLIFLNILLFSVAYLYQAYTSGENPLGNYIDAVTSTVDSVKTPAATTGWFSAVYFAKNVPLYLNGFFGGSARLLWDFTPIWPKYLIYPAWFGLILGLTNKKQRFLSFSLLLFLFVPFLFISTFSTFDMRYIYHAIPTLLLGFAVLLSSFDVWFEKRRLNSVFLILIFAFGGFYFFNNVSRLKYQVALNLRHAEVPWHYIAVTRLNDYFTTDKVTEDKKPIVITPMPPYYIDYFMNNNYKLLPLNKDQEFRLNKTEAWGDEDYSDFHEMYKRHLLAGDPLYVASYGLGNESYLRKSFDELSNDFILTEVADGCYTQCKIYKLELKNAKGS